MHPGPQATRHQQRIHHHVQGLDSQEFFNPLTSPELLDSVESLLLEHRERLFPPTETLSLFLDQAMSADRSCQKVVNDAAIKRLVCGLKSSTHTGAYCRARQRLPVCMVSTLSRQAGRMMTEEAPEAWQWRGRPVRLVDGTIISMPDRPTNQKRSPPLAG